MPAASSVVSISANAVESHAASGRPETFRNPRTATERRGALGTSAAVNAEARRWTGRGGGRAAAPDERRGQAIAAAARAAPGGEGPPRGRGAALPAQRRHDIAGALKAILGAPRGSA